MKITNSIMQQSAAHLESSLFESHESRRTGNLTRNNTASAAQLSPQPVTPNTVDISDAAKSTQSNEASAITKGIEDAQHDPMLQLIRAVVAMLTGKEIDITEATPIASTENPAPQQTAPVQPESSAGIVYEKRVSYSESESTSFTTKGTVQTSDGRQISFDLSLTMSRSFHSEATTSLQVGNARKTRDPLVINFAGTSVQLTDQRFAFDLNADGTASERINFVTGGSGFLTFDRNNDGRINNGSELFGAKTGDGFAELAQFDDDHNGWIDENDAIFTKLGVWSKSADGSDRFQTLADAGVGAISLSKLSTSFSIKDVVNQLKAQIRSTSVLLKENGTASTVQQVDLTV